jgi:hypothetical protein
MQFYYLSNHWLSNVRPDAAYRYLLIPKQEIQLQCNLIFDLIINWDASETELGRYAANLNFGYPAVFSVQNLNVFKNIKETKKTGETKVPFSKF